VNLKVKKLNKQELTEGLLDAHKKLNIIASSLGHYIHFKEDSEKFDKYLKELKEKNEKQQAEKEKEAK
jgi:hypothetical protein